MRQVAKHVWIGELLTGEYEQREGWEPNVVKCARGEVSRCNLIGTLLQVNNQLILDDGTGSVELRTFEETAAVDPKNTGEIVQVVGRPRKYGESLYLIPEILKEIDAKWALVRKAHLGSMQEKTQEKEAPTPAPKLEPTNKAEKVVSVIAGLDKGGGVFVEDVLEKSELGDAGEEILDQLLRDGEIFEIKPGVVKVL